MKLQTKNKTIEIDGKQIDIQLLRDYNKIMFATMGATGMYEPEDTERLEKKWGSFEEYRERLHDKILEQAGFDMTVRLRSEPEVAKFQRALDGFMDDLSNFDEQEN